LHASTFSFIFIPNIWQSILFTDMTKWLWRLLSCGICLHIIWYILTSASEEVSGSIFRLESVISWRWRQQIFLKPW
jgi:hypothetical protein